MSENTISLYVYKGGQGEITEKKSRFIATVRPVESEDEAVSFINETKKKYWDARHNCSAFVIGKRQELTRCSDDGEPAGTAGRPMLDVLLKENIHNAAIVVTRYFGGVLLGTGGLVRAYQQATKAGLSASEIIEKKDGAVLFIRTDYTGIGTDPSGVSSWKWSLRRRDKKPCGKVSRIMVARPFRQSSPTATP